MNNATSRPENTITHANTTKSKNKRKTGVKDNLHIYYQNVRGLRTKTHNFLLSVNSCEYDVIALTETWLNPAVYNGELFCSEFMVFRCDRSKSNSECKLGGGVLIAVRCNNTISCEQIFVPGAECIEIVFVRVKCEMKITYLCCLYIPSGANDTVYESYITILQLFFETAKMEVTDNIVLIGDFNIPSVDWVRDEDNEDVLLPTNVDREIADQLLKTLLSYGLSQLNFVRNFQGRLLDLLFVNCSCETSIIRCEIPLSKVDIYHDPIEIILDISKEMSRIPEISEPAFNFRKTDFVSLNAFFESIEWDVLLSETTDCNENVNRLYEVLMDGFNRCVPKAKPVKDNHPLWYDRSILKLKNKKKRAHKRYKKTKLRSDHAIYNDLRKKFYSYQSVLYKQYLLRTQQNLSNNPSQFWSYVDQKRKTIGYPNTMSYGPLSASNTVDICNLFVSFFKTVYCDDDDDNIEDDIQQQNFILHDTVSLGSIRITYDEVMKSLLGLNINKGSGPDNVPPKVLRSCAETLCYPLHMIFNSSLRSGIFPSRWKTSYVTPIFKSGARNKVENYRAITIQATLGKLFESIVYSNIRDCFKHHVSNSQHGFVPKRSGTTNLIEYVSYAVNVIESGSQLDAVYTDLTKAFDRVRHSLLVRKLKDIGVHSKMLDWFRSFLTDRSQFVKIGGCKSELFPVLSGVPQGSHLGPLFFILFINDVVDVFKNANCLLYADDLKLFYRVDSIIDAINLQHDLDAFSSWCQKNLLEINISKCLCISFHRKKSPLKFEYYLNNVALMRAYEVRDLGIILDEKLTFNKHISYAIAKSFAMLGFIMRICVEFRDPRTLKALYFAYVRSILEYGSVVWCPTYQVLIDRIESIQRRFVWFVFCKFGWQEYVRFAPYNFKCHLLELESLHCRRRNSGVIFVHDIFSGHIDSPNLLSMMDINVPPRRFRNSDLLHIRNHRTNYGSAEPITRISKVFNEFSAIIDFSFDRNRVRKVLSTVSIP